MACASRRGAEPSAPEPAAAVDDPSARSEGVAVSAAAARIYMLGEQRYAEGRFDEAVALWGHTMLQLPADPSADEVRHKLLARMAYGLLQANAATGDPSYLHDGQAMCELYLAKHEELFGDTEPARAQRGEIYELLYEFDSRLDALDPEQLELELATADEPEAAVAAVASPSPRASSPGATEEIDEDGIVRDVRVRRIAWADEDDPRVRGFLGDMRFTGNSMLDHGFDHVHEERVLVRVGALPRPLDASDDDTARTRARKGGLAVVDAARAELARCYERAVSRDPVVAARISVEVSLRADGTVAQARIVDGTVVDAEGDACVSGVLHATRVASPGGALRLSMPVHFFFQDATTTAELFRRERPVSGRAYELTSRSSGLPPIELSSNPELLTAQELRHATSTAYDPGEIRE
ncbi:MAG: hypothetical protein H6712_06150 [Myxococcales bacterium]|nr:hypothetical protein [Myxococcales bacterium]MCB9713419.1 hypothetical protein [Myxococcales bacterium]